MKESSKIVDETAISKPKEEGYGDRNLFELNQEIKREFLKIYQRDLDIDSLIDALPIEG